jgi:hypothetical protein
MKMRMNKRTNLADTSRHARWIVTPTYRSERGPVVVDHHIEELCDLPDLIEDGPNWNSLVEVKVVFNPLRRILASPWRRPQSCVPATGDPL